MSTIFVLGACAAAVKAAQEIQKKNSEDTVVLYSLDGSKPLNQDGIAAFLGKKKTLGELDYPTGDLKIETEQKISKVNLKRKRLYLENKEQVAFDQMVIAETGAWKFPEIKGTNKTGCFILKGRKNLEKILDQISLSEDIIFQSETPEGLACALALTKRERTVTLAYTGRSLLPGMTDPEMEAAFVAYCATQGLVVYPRVSIAEILGDAELKAVRLSSGKVLAAQCVLFPEARPDVRIFSEPPELRHGLLDINDKYETTVSGIYALGPCAQGDFLSTAEAEYHAGRLAQVLAVETPITEAPLKDFSLHLEGLHLARLGNLQGAEGVVEQVYWQKEPFIWKKFWVRHNCLQGVLLVNAPEDEAKLREYLTQRTPVEGQLAQFAIPEMAVKDT